MSYLSAGFFAWVQGAPFYADLHAQAVELLREGDGKSWLDVGCGPGLVARLANNRNYQVLGLDPDPAMIRIAAHKSSRDTRCRFEIGGLENASRQYNADVVSAASLLCVLPDPVIALHQLWDCVRPHGRLLVIETTTKMTPKWVCQVCHTTRPGRRLGLHLWARARQGRAVAPEVFESLPAQSHTCIPLLSGLVQARVFLKGP